MRSWLCTHAHSSLDKFLSMGGDFKSPMVFSAETELRKFVAYIDPEDKFAIEDKLSQVINIIRNYIKNYLFVTVNILVIIFL